MRCGSKYKTESTLTHVVCNVYLLLTGIHNSQQVSYQCKVCFQGRKDQHTHSQVLAYKIQRTVFSTSSVFFYKQEAYKLWPFYDLFSSFFPFPRSNLWIFIGENLVSLFFDSMNPLGECATSRRLQLGNVDRLALFLFLRQGSKKAAFNDHLINTKLLQN